MLTKALILQDTKQLTEGTNILSELLEELSGEEPLEKL